MTVVNSAADVGVYAITGAASNSKSGDVILSGEWTKRMIIRRSWHHTVTLRPVEVSIGMAGGFYGDKPDLSNVVLDYEETSENRGLADGEMSIDEIILDTDATSPALFPAIKSAARSCSQDQQEVNSIPRRDLETICDIYR